MEIKVLGKGCSRCEEVEKRTINALAELDVAASIQKVKNPTKISYYGVFATPCLIINNKIKAQGRIPSLVEIKEWIKEEMAGNLKIE